MANQLIHITAIACAAALWAAPPTVGDSEWACEGFKGRTIPPPPPPPPTPAPVPFSEIPYSEASPVEAKAWEQYREWHNKHWCEILTSLAPTPGYMINREKNWKQILIVRKASWFGQTLQIMITIDIKRKAHLSYWSFPPWVYISNKLREKYKATKSPNVADIINHIPKCVGQFDLNETETRALRQLLSSRLPKHFTAPNPDDSNHWVLSIHPDGSKSIYQFYGSQADRFYNFWVNIIPRVPNPALNPDPTATIR